MCVFLDLPLLGSFVRTPPGTCTWVGPWRWRSRAQRRPLRSSTEARRNAESHSPSSTRRAAEVTQSSPYAWYRFPWTTVARKSFRYVNDIVTTVTLLRVMYVTTILTWAKALHTKSMQLLSWKPMVTKLKAGMSWNLQTDLLWWLTNFQISALAHFLSSTFNSPPAKVVRDVMHTYGHPCSLLTSRTSPRWQCPSSHWWTWLGQSAPLVPTPQGRDSRRPAVSTKPYWFSELAWKHCETTNSTLRTRWGAVFVSLVATHLCM